jgi:hypothetical protein
MAYVYRHIRLDKNEPFYIGISSDDDYSRAYSTDARNPYWHNIIEKTNYEIEIILDNLLWEDACKKEVELIKLYGRKDLKTGTLVNMTNGGEGVFGLIFSKDHRNKISNSNKGKRLNKKCSIEHRNNISNSLKGHITSKETKLKISIANKGKKRSNECKEKLRLASLGNKKMLGKKHSEETKKKMKEKALQKDPKSIKKMAETKKGANNPRAKMVDQYTKDGKFIKTWSYITEVTKKLSIYHIDQVCLGKRKTAGGYIWKYKIN